MKMCLDHWEKLRQAIKDRGLWHLVSNGGEEVVKKLTDELKTGNSNIENFDPLMFAHNIIVSNALVFLGLELMMSDKCPICELAKHCDKCKEESENWITYASDGVKTFYEKEITSTI